MNKIIWRNIESTEIKGLLICELPAITKPKMRVQETEIDGVDGSIIEDLGYESYDKTITIGLYKNFDIDEVIEYFTGEGQVVFSNEPDKYYNAKIIEQIDYERLLRYKTATVKFRVQPFKYEYNEVPTELLAETIEGSNITLNDKKVVGFSLEGKSTQETRSGSNMLDFNLEQDSRVTTNDDGTITINGAGGFSINFSPITLKAGTTYYQKFVLVSGTISGLENVFMSFSGSDWLWLGDDEFFSYTPSEDVEKSGIWVNEGVTFENAVIKLWANTDQSDFEQYGVMPSPDYPSEIKSVGTYNEETGKYEIKVQITNGTDTNTSLFQLDQPLRSLPNGVKDIAYIKSGKLYVDRKVGSIIFDGNQEFSDYSEDTTNGYACVNYINSEIKKTSEIATLSDKLIGTNVANTWAKNMEGVSLGSNGTYIQLSLKISRLSSQDATGFKNFFLENPTKVDYELATSIIEELGDLTLNLVDGENNISNSEDANMIIDYADNKLIVNNLGNYISKPVITIVGEGIIELIVNDNKLFRYTFPEDENLVVIDSQKQDAYLGSVLKNRNMSGEFPTFETGENTITWEGTINSIRISSKSRWL